MKYNVIINQKALFELGKNLDFNDGAIFDFIKDFSNSEKCHKVRTPEGEFFWISHNLIIENLPMLGISTSKGISKRIDKLIDSGLLVKYKNSAELSRSYYRFGPNYDLVTFVHTPEQKFQAPGTKVPGPRNKSSSYYIYNDYIHNDNNKKEFFLEEEKREKEFQLSGVFEKEKFFEKLSEQNKNGIDLNYYYHAVDDWSQGLPMKDKRKYKTDRGWIAEARKFMRNDKDKNKLKMVGETDKNMEEMRAYFARK